MLERDIGRAITGLDAGLSWWRDMPDPWQRGAEDKTLKAATPGTWGRISLWRGSVVRVLGTVEPSQVVGVGEIADRID